MNSNHPNWGYISGQHPGVFSFTFPQAPMPARPVLQHVYPVQQAHPVHPGFQAQTNALGSPGPAVFNPHYGQGWWNGTGHGFPQVQPGPWWTNN